MKKFSFVLMLLMSINSKLFAQTNTTQNRFELPEGTVTRVFFIDLGKSDKIKLELSDLEDLDMLPNIDSLLQAFIVDVEPLKDSLADELTAKRIDYIIQPSGKNLIRFQQFAATGSSYLADKGTIAALKLQQDTVNIILQANGSLPQFFNVKKPGIHFYRICFFVNNLSNLASYKDQLQSHIELLKKDVTNKWKRQKDGMMHLKTAPSIYSKGRGGQVGYNDYLTFNISADIQNYKNYFVPSLSASVIVVTNRNSIKREFSFTGESHFTFARNDQGELQTFRNGFITLGYSQTNKGQSGFSLNPSFSLGYLLRQRGDVYDKHTFRLGFGKVMLFNKVKLEPVVYFHDFFKNVTPGIRLSL